QARASTPGGGTTIGGVSKEDMMVIKMFLDPERSATFLSWLESKEPESKFVRRLGTFPECEHPLLAACILHCGLVRSASQIMTILLNNGGEFKDIEAHNDFLKIWRRIVELRVYLRHERTKFRQLEDFPEIKEVSNESSEMKEEHESEETKDSES